MKKELDKAKDYCYRLFKFRLRSEREIRERLKRKKFSPETIEKVIIHFKDLRFINDSIFTKSWIEARLKKPYGLKRIIYELKNKGISEKIIEEEIQKIKKDYSEYEIVKGLAEEKFERFKGIDPEKSKRRIYSFLLRRGFSPEIIFEVLSEKILLD